MRTKTETMHDPESMTLSGALPSLAEDAVDVAMHGVRLRLQSNHRPLLEYARNHLSTLAGRLEPPFHLQVRAYWLRGQWNPDSHPFPANGNLSILGKRMAGQKNELIWRNTLKMKGLQLRFSRNRNNTYTFDVVYYFNPKKEKLDRLPEYEYKKYFSLMSYMVYYPLMWYLERERGMVPLHASALQHDRGAILIGGLGGVGKTTTCVALMQIAGLRLIAENIVFTDGEAIYPCYEPIRLDEDSLGMLRNSRQKLAPMAFPEGLKEKWLFHYDTAELPQQVPPAAVFLPVFASGHGATAVAPEIAAEKMINMNRLTRELDDYEWYAAALNMIWPQPGLAARRAQTVARCFSRVPCYELIIDRRAGLQAVVEDIVQQV